VVLLFGVARGVIRVRAGPLPECEFVTCDESFFFVHG
jgi:hypothetical protein